MQWRNSTNTSLEAISHCPQITIRYCQISVWIRIPTYSTNHLTQNSGTKIRKASDFGQGVGKNVIVSIAIEKDTQSIPADYIWNIPLIPNQTPHELAKDPVLQKVMNWVQRKWLMPNCRTYSIVARPYLFLANVCCLRREGERES